MAKYLKHYWKKNGSWLTTPGTYVEQHHPEADYPGLGVKVWMHDSDGVDVCLSEVPDSTAISTITVGSKNAVIELTETQYNSVKTPHDEAGTLRQEALEAEMSGDTDTAATKNTAADAKFTEAQNALNAL
tara:strand:- start:179 stop:568 length:390 start_codon:yes stop_codon:yes gene_type:complete